MTEEWFAVIWGLLFKSLVEAQRLEHAGRGVPDCGGWEEISEWEEAGGLAWGRAEEGALRETEEAEFCGCPC